MKPIGVLKDTPWKFHTSLGKFIETLSEKGIVARLVGGAVRETLSNRFNPNADIDLAVDAHPDEIIATCLELGIQVIPSGLIYGTVTCIVDNKTYEVTSLRQDISTDGRKAVVKYTQNWDEDAYRRDLTINALYADWDGHYYDPTGMGYDDLCANHIRFIGNPEQRIEEDFLRIIRFFRFMAMFPNPSYDSKAYNLCMDMAKNLKKISLERKWIEIQKAFQSPYPLNAIDALISSNVMTEVCRINWSLNKLECSLPWVKNYFQDIFYAILGSVHHFKMDRSICIPISVQKRLEDAFKFNLSNGLILDKKDIYMMGRPAYKDLYIRYTITTQKFSDENLDNCKDALMRIDTAEIPIFPVSGDDLQELGLHPGPIMGQILKETERWWLSKNFIPSFEECIQYIQHLQLSSA